MSTMTSTRTQSDSSFRSGERTAQATPSLRAIFRSHRGRIVATYALFNIENALRLAQPFVLGIAINDLLVGRYFGLLLFIAQHLSFMLVGSLRQIYDTRVFTDIYAQMATGLITNQRKRDIDVSRVAARSSLSREYVDFFEQSLPMIMRASYSVVGALLMLGYYDWTLIPLCLILVVPAMLLNVAYGRKTLALSRGLHDEYEREIGVIEEGEPREIRRHFDSVSHWMVKLSDAEATNFCLMELFVLGLMATALVQFCTQAQASPGDIFAVFRYVLLFVMGLDSVPRLVEQVSRIRDIGGRLK